MKKKVLIFGITGQIGSYLADLYLEKGYEVHGVIRRHSNTNGTERIDHIYNQIKLHYGDVTDATATSGTISSLQPDIIINMAAMSHVRVSFDIPNYTAQVDAVGTLNILEAIRLHCPTAKFLQSSTSELYGGLEYNKNTNGVYDETSPFHPRSPYGVAKIFGYWIVRNYRESYGLYACNSIFFNNESERRGETFVTRKITKAFSNIKHGKQDVLILGNLDAKRDWGYSPDYCRGLFEILQQDQPDDYILATSETHTVREFVEEAAQYCDWDIEWKGEGVEEKGYDKKTGKLLIEIDPKYFRPAEVDVLIGDYSKAKEKLGWEPQVKFKELVKIMMEHDLEN